MDISANCVHISQSGIARAVFCSAISQRSFYLQELGDKLEGARVYELLLERFPNNPQNDVIFYSLYRAYQGEDEQNAERYKALVLKNYPNSVYAKTIIDPAYSIKQTANEQIAMRSYNDVYTAYEKKSYSKVITETDAALRVYPNNNFKSQFEYLKAIAIGRTNNVDTLLLVFNNIVSKYPEDKVITPLVREHIAYINGHLPEFRARRYALLDFNANEPRFIVEQAPVTTTQPSVSPTIVQKTEEKPVQQTAKDPVKAPVTTTPVTTPIVKTNDAPAGPVIKSDGLFTNAPSQTYYFVVVVNDASLTLSSSRFGIGQFNRSNFTDNNLRHQLTELDNDQLIYVST
ncbi:MAG: hypothetical protein EOP51_32355, partial [Sphingobacteriales bacterium]